VTAGKQVPGEMIHLAARGSVSDEHVLGKSGDTLITEYSGFNGGAFDRGQAKGEHEQATGFD
jgi:hypothetical protein